jgi:hypothetical protein
MAGAVEWYLGEKPEKDSCKLQWELHKHFFKCFEK